MPTCYLMHMFSAQHIKVYHLISLQALPQPYLSN